MSPVTVAWAIQQNKGVFGNHFIAVNAHLIDSHFDNLMCYATKYNEVWYPLDLRQNIVCGKPNLHPINHFRQCLFGVGMCEWA